MCENCGWQALCPHCDIPLTYHADTFKLHCHSCSFSSSTPHACPECGHPAIMFKTVGTKAIVDEIQRIFPEARVARFDTDNKKAERFEQLYESVVAGDIDILVGTQLLAKGLDLPKLSTVGVILADTSLYMPDFTAEERTYQLLTQIIGRVGRGHRDGHAVIQTYHPGNHVLKDVLDNNWQDFYTRQLKERESVRLARRPKQTPKR
jgi:primosomal protein N' (replication factor Y)